LPHQMYSRHYYDRFWWDMPTRECILQADPLSAAKAIALTIAGQTCGVGSPSYLGIPARIVCLTISDSPRKCFLFRGGLSPILNYMRENAVSESLWLLSSSEGISWR
jgi:hypothetical protein